MRFVEAYSNKAYYQKLARMRMQQRQQEAAKVEVTEQDLERLGELLDKLYNTIGIDIEITRTHFIRRLNDPRNPRPITLEEVSRLFKKVFYKYNAVLADGKHWWEAVMRDSQNDLHIPFQLEWDDKNKEMDLIAKTAIKKRNFRSDDRGDPFLSV